MILIMFEQMLANVPGVRPIHVGTGDLIFRQGEAVTAIFQVKDGSVAMLRHLSDGALLTVATAGAGETFAEAALFAEHYHCDAIARTKAEILSVPSLGLRRQLASDPELAIEFAAILGASGSGTADEARNPTHQAGAGAAEGVAALACKR